MQRQVILFAALGVAAAVVPTWAMWGFTVDDALISTRYALHVASGAGYRFNAHGPATDGVTPLPWVPILALVAKLGGLGPLDGLRLLHVAKWIGAAAWVASAGLLGADLGRRAGTSRRGQLVAALALGVLALAFGVGAWAASGMETGLATALATTAAVSWERPRRLALLAGLAAALRPEMTPWAMTLAAASAVSSSRAVSASLSRRPKAVSLAVAIAFAPFALCSLVRLVSFGNVAPLAVAAKPSDLSHGLVYAGAAFVVTLMPVLAFAPVSLVRGASAPARGIVVAALVQMVVLVAVGGDWMPYARLVVPIVPSLAVAFVEVSKTASLWVTLVRSVLVVVLGGAIAVRAAPAGRHVQGDREALIARARPVLASSRVVAALDVGWVGAATSGSIVDLAGLTDPTIAILPGGHTSKRVDLSMLLDREVDTLVIYGDHRAVEARITFGDLFERRFVESAVLTLGDRGSRYVVYRRR